MFTLIGRDALRFIPIRFVRQRFVPDMSDPYEKRMINETYSVNIPIGFKVKIVVYDSSTKTNYIVNRP